MHLLPDPATAQAGYGHAARLAGYDLRGRAAWACTLWFSGHVATAVFTQEEPPDFDTLLKHFNAHEALWNLTPAASD